MCNMLKHADDKIVLLYKLLLAEYSIDFPMPSVAESLKQLTKLLTAATAFFSNMTLFGNQAAPSITNISANGS